MPKADVNPFKTYRLRESATVNAVQSPKAFNLGGVPFQAGDFLLQDDGGNLTGMAATDFEAKYEIVKPKVTRTRRTKEQIEADKAAEGSAPQSEAVPETSEAAA